MGVIVAVASISVAVGVNAVVALGIGTSTLGMTPWVGVSVNCGSMLGGRVSVGNSCDGEGIGNPGMEHPAKAKIKIKEDRK